MTENKKRIYAAGLKSRRVTVDDTDWQHLKKIGDGNASHGLRELIKLFNESKLR